MNREGRVLIQDPPVDNSGPGQAGFRSGTQTDFGAISNEHSSHSSSEIWVIEPTRGSSGRYIFLNQLPDHAYLT